MLIESWKFGEYGGHVIVIAMQFVLCFKFGVLIAVGSENSNFKLFCCT